MTRESALKPRKTYSELPDEDRSVIDIVRAAGKPLPRLALARGFSGRRISRLIAEGHLAETINGEVTPAPVALREMTDQRISQSWRAGKGYCQIASFVQTKPGDVFKRVHDLGLDSSARRKGRFQVPVEGHKVRLLRLVLVDAERRGLDANDDGGDIEHRAAGRRFREARKLARRFPKDAPETWSAGAVTELRQLRDLGKSVAWIAGCLGRPCMHVAQRLILEGRSTRAYWEEWEEKILHDGLRSGHSYNAIATRLPGRSIGAVKKRAMDNWPRLSSRRKWTLDAENRLARALVNGLEPKKRAALFPERSGHAVRRQEYRILTMDLSGEPITRNELRIVKIGMEQGRAADEIAAYMGRQVDEVRKVISAIKGKVPGRKAAFTKEQTEEIRRRLAAPGVTHEEVAKSYGVSRGTMYRALERYPEANGA